MKKAIDFFTSHPAWFFFPFALLCAGAMYFINKQQGISWHEIFVEANGLVFDLLVFGILLSIYEKLREKRDKIERLREEIDDYREWDEKEAKFRIVAAIKRLNKLGVSNIHLGLCYLQEAYLEKANLKGAFLGMANLQKANLWYANLQKASLAYANLKEANLGKANLRQAVLIGANLQEADLRGANLEWAAVVHKDWFEKLEEWNVKGREEIKAKYLIDKIGVLREKQ